MDAQAVALKALFNELNLKHIAHKVEEFLVLPENCERPTCSSCWMFSGQKLPKGGELL